MIVLGWDIGPGDRTSIVVGERLDGHVRVHEVLTFEGDVPGAVMVKSGDFHEWVLRLSAVRLELEMRRRGVRPEIIARVLRLNPPDTLERGYALRGIHYKPGRWWGLPRGLVQKGEVIRRYGRDVFARIPRERWVKNGRRVWVGYRDLDAAVRS